MKYKITIRIIILLALLVPVFGGVRLEAQTTKILKGVVRDEYGKPLINVVVYAPDEENRTMTGSDGQYALMAQDDVSSLIFSCIGYQDKKVKILNADQPVNVTLDTDENNLNELIRLGYSSQRRGELSGAVSTVAGEELKKSPVANLAMTFEGRLPGLFTHETASELSRASTDLFVRGVCANRANGPLVIIDGIVCSYKSNQSLEYISPEEIESVTLLKDASTEALYGIQGANGVVVITTKRGTPGKLKVNVRIDESLQQMTTKPAFINSAEYAQLRNEAARNDGKGQNYFFSDDQIGKYRSGNDRNLYPNTNWYNLFLKEFAQMQRVGIDLSGGNEKVRYFTNINTMHQGSQFKTDQSEYDTKPNFTWINFRSNVESKINDYLGAYLHLSGNIKRERVPGNGTFSQALYSSIFYMPSTIYGPVTPTAVDPETGDISGNQVITTSLVSNPTYGMLNRAGYTRHTVTNIYAQFGLNLDMKFLTPGLKASGVIAYQTNSVNSLYTTQDYERWVRTDDLDTLAFVTKGSNTNTTLSYSKGSSYYYHLTYQGMMNYERSFGLHEVTGMAYAFYDNLSKVDTGSPENLPYNRFSSGVEATYGYARKYLLKLDAGYSGSGQYARSHRYTLTPAVSGAWVISKEDFMKEIRGIDYLKVRASYGKTANDQDNKGRFIYLDNVTFNSGGPIGDLRFIIDENQTGNPNYEAEIVKKQNYGIDLGLFRQLSLSVDLFKEHLGNMVLTPSAYIPSYQGIPLENYPVTNSGAFENKGCEISASWKKSITRNLTANLGGFLMYAKNKELRSLEAVKSEDYAYRKRAEGYSYGQSWGYLVDYGNGNGFFNSQSEIDNSGLTYSFGTPRVGDLKYQDLNNDQTIDEKDQAPIGKGSIPRYYYGFSGGFTYKSFDFSFLFQGVGQWSSVYSGIGVYETSYDGVFGSLHKNAWTEERYSNGEKITAPALSLTKSVSHESNDYYEYNRAYLRLKNVEISYTLPKRIYKSLSASEVRFILSGQNLLTWDKMKSNDFGPEAESYDAIPVYRVYNAGVSIRF